MGIFASDDFFSIVVKYVIVKTKGGSETVKVFDESKKEDKESMEKFGGKVKSLTTNWTIPNWKQSNELLRKCMRYDAEAGKKELDWPLYRALIIETFMKNWDATDDSGNTVKCSKESIDKLDTSVAVSLVDKFLDRTTITEQDLGN